MENLSLDAISIKALTELLVTYGPRVLGAVVVLIIGWRIIRIIKRGLLNMMERREIDPSLRSFLISLIVNLLKVLLVISVLGMIGVEMTSFIALLGAAGLAVGLALSGTLQNFAGGVMILLFKPFKAGDYIEAQGFAGTVKEIQIFNTILITPDNKIIIIPNGGLSTGSMVNFSAEPIRRVDWTFSVAYGDDTDQAISVLMGLLKADERVLTEPEPFVAVSSLGESSGTSQPGPGLKPLIIGQYSSISTKEFIKPLPSEDLGYLSHKWMYTCTTGHRDCRCKDENRVHKKSRTSRWIPAFFILQVS